MAAPAHRLRHPGCAGGKRRRQGPAQAPRPRLPPRPPRSVPVRGPAGARPPQERVPPALLQARLRPLLHAEVHEQRAPPLRVRRGAALRHRGAAGDMGQHHQRVRRAAQGGAQAVPDEGAAATAQTQGDRRLPPAAVLLREPVRAQGAGPRGGGGEGHLEALACHQLPERGAASRGAGGPIGELGSPAVREAGAAALRSDRPVLKQRQLSGDDALLPCCSKDNSPTSCNYNNSISISVVVPFPSFLTS